MKKAALKTCFIVITALLIPFVSKSSHAVEALIGAKVWYVSWRPYLIDVGEKIAPWEGWQHIKGGSGMMYGPSASLLITDRLTFSVSYLYGELGADYNVKSTELEGGGLREYHYSGYARTIRHDLDSALSYALLQNLKVFAGFKYQPLILKAVKQGVSWELDAGGNRVPGGQHVYIDDNELTFRQYNYAPGLGLGYTASISDKFTVTMNLSLIYFFGIFKINTGETLYYYPDLDTSLINPSYKYRFDSSGFGLNAEPGIVVMLNEKIVLSLGFRFQYVRLSVKNADGLEDTEGLNDYVYGGYLSALYRL